MHIGLTSLVGPQTYSRNFEVEKRKRHKRQSKQIQKIMEDLKIYGISISALGGGMISELNPVLSTLVLTTTLVYTIIQISEKLKNKNK